MFKKKLVSVVIPTKNRLSLLKTTLNSVYNQTYRKIEIIVVDDQSGDNTQEYCLNQPSLKYILNDSGINGPSRTRNLGISKASGEFILFLDDDDLIHPNHLQEMIEAARRLDSKYVPSGRWRLFEERNDRIYFGPEMKFSGEKSFEDSIANMIDPSISDNIINSSFLWRKDQIDSIRWNEELFTNGDLDYYAQALMKGLRFYGVNVGYVYYRSHQIDRVAGTKTRKGLESSTRHRLLWSDKLINYRNLDQINIAFRNSFMSLLLNWAGLNNKPYEYLQIKQKLRDWGNKNYYIPMKSTSSIKSLIAKLILRIGGDVGLEFIGKIIHLNKRNRSPLTLQLSDHETILTDINNRLDARVENLTLRK